MSKASGATLAGQKFGAATGPTGLSLPAGLSTTGSVAVKIATVDKSINTYAGDSDVEPKSDMVGGVIAEPNLARALAAALTLTLSLTLTPALAPALTLTLALTPTLALTLTLALSLTLALTLTLTITLTRSRSR